jgi:hypothetical protein
MISVVNQKAKIKERKERRGNMNERRSRRGDEMEKKTVERVE